MGSVSVDVPTQALSTRFDRMMDSIVKLKNVPTNTTSTLHVNVMASWQHWDNSQVATHPHLQQQISTLRTTGKTKHTLSTSCPLPPRSSQNWLGAIPVHLPRDTSRGESGMTGLQGGRKPKRQVKENYTSTANAAKSLLLTTKI